MCFESHLWFIFDEKLMGTEVGKKTLFCVFGVLL